MRIAPGHTEVLKPAAQSGRITLIVARGALDVRLLNNAPVTLEEGDALLFDARLKHSISNVSGNESTAYSLLDARGMRV